MLPPRMTGCDGSAARSVAVRADVVVLPFVPVTPMVGATHSRRNRSGSETRAGASGSPSARAPTSAWSAVAKPRFGRREVRIDGRRRGDECGIGPGGGRIHVRSEPRRDVHVRRSGSTASASSVSRSTVVDRHRRTRIDQEPGERDPASGEAEDRHRSDRGARRPGPRPWSACPDRSAATGVIVVTSADPATPGRASRRAAPPGSR